MQSKPAAVPTQQDPEPVTGTDPQTAKRPLAMSDGPKVVARPVPKMQTEDPREFQMGQMRRRFKPTESEDNDCSSLTFQLVPSDPDFPYDIESLECMLWIPKSYPAAGRPTLTVKNKDIPRGFQINIERGYDAIVAGAPQATLLGLMNRLDKQLETILAGKMTETVKIVPNAGQSRPTPKSEPKPPQPTTVPVRQIDLADPTADQKSLAKAKRQTDVRQLEARFSRLPSFAKSADGLTFTLPLDSPKRSTWPSSLQALQTVKITVPELYPIAPAQLKLESNTDEARAVETAFQRRSEEEPNATVTQQLNYLGQNLKQMSVTTPRADPLKAKPVIATTSHSETKQPETRPDQRRFETSKSHVHLIPRPIEWSQPASNDDATDSDESSSEAASSAGDEDATQLESLPEETTTSAPAERGILLSFPQLDLHGIELLELTSLNVTVKCERCKEIMDVERLRSGDENSTTKQVSCKKCANGMAVRFRADMIHANSVRAGYLDLDGCAVVDMLPSQFQPSCSECSTTYPAPGVSAVRGDSAMAICRECHKRMSFRIQEVKFLQTSAAAIRASRTPGRKKQRENLGITAGTPLPNEGRCTHYKKSYRWFRFSCCNRVFPCDRCHDEKEDHPPEFANRMLCGYCSREQNYRPEDCGICHAHLTKKAGKGFWEGGKGTRDPARMSRKDPRKYKRRPGTKPKT